jgi:hypothetical protein
MIERSKIIGLVLAAMILGVVVVVASRSRELSYRGRSLTNWLKRYAYASLDKVQRTWDCGEAIRVVGKERAVRLPLRMDWALLAGLFLEPWSIFQTWTAIVQVGLLDFRA